MNFLSDFGLTTWWLVRINKSSRLSAGNTQATLTNQRTLDERERQMAACHCIERRALRHDVSPFRWGVRLPAAPGVFVDLRRDAASESSGDASVRCPLGNAVSG